MKPRSVVSIRSLYREKGQNETLINVLLAKTRLLLYTNRKEYFQADRRGHCLLSKCQKDKAFLYHIMNWNKSTNMYNRKS